MRKEIKSDLTFNHYLVVVQREYLFSLMLQPKGECVLCRGLPGGGMPGLAGGWWERRAVKRRPVSLPEGAPKGGCTERRAQPAAHWVRAQPTECGAQPAARWARAQPTECGAQPAVNRQGQSPLCALNSQKQRLLLEPLHDGPFCWSRNLYSDLKGAAGSPYLFTGVFILRSRCFFLS